MTSLGRVLARILHEWCEMGQFFGLERSPGFLRLCFAHDSWFRHAFCGRRAHLPLTPGQSHLKCRV